MRHRCVTTVLAVLVLCTPRADVQAQEGAAGWEVRVVMDATRHRMRRVRPIFVRPMGGTLAAPALGDATLAALEQRDMVGPWPGLGVEGAAVSPMDHLGPLGATGNRADTRQVHGERLEVAELEGRPGSRWYRPGGAVPEWTAILTDGGRRVVTLRPPFSLPLLPDAVPVDTRDVVWVLRHGEDGAVDWAVALGNAGSQDVNWEAFWRAPGAGGPADLDAALQALPKAMVRHVRGRYGQPAAWRPVSAAMALVGSARYNRVEGLSAAVPVWLDATPTVRLNAWTRLSTTSFPPTAGLGVVLDRWPSRWGVEGYRRLKDANLWEPAHRKGNTVRALFLGRDDGHYYRSEGVSLWTDRVHGMGTWRLELFAERDRTAEPRTSYHLFHFRDSKGINGLGPTLQAEDGDYAGIRGVYEHQWGLTSAQGIVVSRMWWEAAGGDRDFVSFGGMLEVLKSSGRWAVGARAGAGRAWGDAPLQRQYFLGGTTNVRGFGPASAAGPVVALGRLEVGYGIPAVRLVAFGDAGGAGEPGALTELAAIGLGVSFAEGLMRLDFAKAVKGGPGFKVYLSGNGLL